MGVGDKDHIGLWESRKVLRREGEWVDVHRRESGFVGYLVMVGGKAYYHSGDTDRIPEMKGLKPDTAMLPIGGTYTMTAEEAVGAAEDLGFPTVVPMHFGSIVGSPDEGERFKELAGDRFKVVVMTPEG